MGMCAELPLMDVCEKGHLWAVFFVGAAFLLLMSGIIFYWEVR